MKNRITEISCKEVINVCDGTRYGYVNDIEIDCACGTVISLIIHGGGFGGLFSKNEDIIIPWEAIKQIGEDIILVDFAYEPPCRRQKMRIFSKKI